MPTSTDADAQSSSALFIKQEQDDDDYEIPIIHNTDTQPGSTLRIKRDQDQDDYKVPAVPGADTQPGLTFILKQEQDQNNNEVPSSVRRPIMDALPQQRARAWSLFSFPSSSDLPLWAQFFCVALYASMVLDISRTIIVQIDYILRMAGYLFGVDLSFWIRHVPSHLLLVGVFTISLFIPLDRFVLRYKNSAITRYMLSLPWWSAVLYVLGHIVLYGIACELMSYVDKKIWFATFGGNHWMFVSLMSAGLNLLQSAASYKYVSWLLEP